MSLFPLHSLSPTRMCVLLPRLPLARVYSPCSERRGREEGEGEGEGGEEER